LAGLCDAKSFSEVTWLGILCDVEKPGTKLGAKTTDFPVVKRMVDVVGNSSVKAMNTFFDIVLRIIFFYPTTCCYKTILLKKREIFQLTIFHIQMRNQPSK